MTSNVLEQVIVIFSARQIFFRYKNQKGNICTNEEENEEMFCFVCFQLSKFRFSEGRSRNKLYQLWSKNQPVLLNRLIFQYFFSKKKKDCQHLQKTNRLKKRNYFCCQYYEASFIKNPFSYFTQFAIGLKSLF